MPGLQILGDILIMSLVVVLAIAGYAFRKAVTYLSFRTWVMENLFRFALGEVLIIGLAILIHTTPEIVVVLRLIGFDVQASPIAIAIGIATALIVSVDAKKDARLQFAALPEQSAVQQNERTKE